MRLIENSETRKEMLLRGEGREREENARAEGGTEEKTEERVKKERNAGSRKEGRENT